MCGIAGILDLSLRKIERLPRRLEVMAELMAHRGPDGQGVWMATSGAVGLAHRRLAIIDLSDTGRQPMADPTGAVVTYNGEIYNYVELRRALAAHWDYRSTSDTEVLLSAYARWGVDCLSELRGMFAFALWDEKRRRLFCARDRFGIKPFYYAVVGGQLVFASEAKALLPFLPAIETDAAALAEYLTFQYGIGEHTLFKGINRLPPGHALLAENGEIKVWRYWDVTYEIDFDHSPGYFERRLVELLNESVALHLRADVPVGSYLSGGLDSSLVATLAGRANPANNHCFHGKFLEHPGYDESGYARLVAQSAGAELFEIDITADDFAKHIGDVIYHLDYPVAGPGLLPAIHGLEAGAPACARSCSADKAATRCSAAMPAISSPISSSASRRRSTAPAATVISSSPSNRSSPISAFCRNTSR